MSKWISVKDEMPEKDKPVHIDGGIGCWNGKEWLTLEQGMARPIQWPVKYWLPILEAGT